jgi:hypothetical protein
MFQMKKRKLMLPLVGAVLLTINAYSPRRSGHKKRVQ